MPRSAADFDLHAMLVGSGQEEDVRSGESHRPGPDVAEGRGVRMADVGSVVDVVDGGRDVGGLPVFHGADCSAVPIPHRRTMCSHGTTGGSFEDRPAADIVSAVIGALLLVAGAIAFGIHGPRMGQRGIWLEGTPLSEAWFYSIDLYLDWFDPRQPDSLASRESGVFDEPARSIVAAAEALGWTLEGGRSVDAFGGVVDWFTRPGKRDTAHGADARGSVAIHLLRRPRTAAAATPGVRVIEAVPLFELPWPAAGIPAFGDVDELGVVVPGLRDEGVVIVSGGLDAAQRSRTNSIRLPRDRALRDAI